MDRLLSMRVFERVVDEGGFAAAARVLDMSPPVVTRLVADLEEHLGTRLLQRSTRRLALTEAGQAYLNRVRPILQDIDEAHEMTRSHTTALAGLLRLHAPPVLASTSAIAVNVRFIGGSPLLGQRSRGSFHPLSCQKIDARQQQQQGLVKERSGCSAQQDEVRKAKHKAELGVASATAGADALNAASGSFQEKLPVLLQQLQMATAVAVQQRSISSVPVAATRAPAGAATWRRA